MLVPDKGETQEKFIARCHVALKGQYPETDERNAACFRLWESSANDDLEKLATETFPEDRFVRIKDVPIFDEHTGKSKSGEVKRYDRASLEHIMRQCNHRIRDTKDFITSTIGHTPSAKDPDREHKIPPLIGFYGPVRMGQIGNVNPRWCLFADEFVFKDEFERASKHPRRSVEIWADMIFDPIARLGATTPRRDLGLKFSRDEGPEERYEMTTMPSSTSVRPKEPIGKLNAVGKSIGAAAGSVLGNSVAPGIGATIGGTLGGAVGDLLTGEDTQQYDAQGAAMSDDDIRAIIEAIDSLDWVQWVKSQMQKESGGGESTPPAPPAAGDMPPPPEEMGDPSMPPMPGTPAAGDGAPQTEEKFSRDQTMLVAKYRRAESENTQLRERLAGLEQQFQAIRVENENVSRYSRLEQAREVRQFDLNDAFARLRAEVCDRDFFERSLTDIMTNYRPVPAGSEFLRVDTGTYTPARDDIEADKFQRETAEQATREVLDAQKRGEKLDFMSRLAEIRKARGAR